MPPGDPYKYFRLEAREILDQFNTGLLVLEKGADARQLQLLRRLAHTLKGAARVVKQPEIADATHAIEDELSLFPDAPGTPSRENIDAVLRQLDEIAARVDTLGSGDEPAQDPAPARVTATVKPVAAGPPRPLWPQPTSIAPSPPPPAPQVTPIRPGASETTRTIRAEIAEMDALLDGIAETQALLGGLRTTMRSLEQVQHLADLVAEQLVPGRNPGVSQNSRGTNAAYALADELRREVGSIERRMTSAVDQLDRELRQSREAAEQMRLVGAGAVLTALERTARDAAHEMAKEVEFEPLCSDIRLDADILSTVQAALVQLVRNAVAHGIETPAERRAAGKAPAGRITVDIARRGAKIVFACRDDGRGIDHDALRHAALQRGILAADADRLDAHRLMSLLLHGGLSTAAGVTEIAGRGVGLDIVRDAVERLGGSIDVATEPGRGTSFELTVPFSLASIEALMIEAAGSVAAIPLDAVRSTMLLGAPAIASGSGEMTVLHQAQAIPFLWLAGTLSGSQPPVDSKWPAVVVDAPAGRVAVGVGRLLGTQRIVLQPLPELAPAAEFVAAALIDAEGNPQLVLSPDGLVAEARRTHAGAPEQEVARVPILVIDDSLTTRMLEQSILESAGYEVGLAESAEDAMELARRHRYGLFLVDVDMPGMSGFEFVEHIRADSQLRDIPAILVTSRAAPEDRQRGRDVGAQGYVVKGEFDQAELLAMIRTLAG